MIYSQEESANLEVLVDLLEAGVPLFQFVFGNSLLLSKKLRLRNPFLMKAIGAQPGAFCVLGAESNDFHGFEHSFMPIRRFSTAEIDTEDAWTLKSLQEALVKYILPATELKKCPQGLEALLKAQEKFESEERKL